MKMGLSEAQKIAVGDNVFEVLQKNAPELDGGAMDSGAAIEIMTEVRDTALSANEEQHTAMRRAREATARSEAATRRYYVTASGFLDMAIAAVSKDSEAAAEFRKLRSRVARPPRKVVEAPTPIEPVRA